MNVLIAADSFKDALSAEDVCFALARGIGQAWPSAQLHCFPLADGGEGTFEVLSAHLQLQKITVSTCDPLQRPLEAPYGLSAHGKTAFIEMAMTAGLPLLRPEERNPLETTTFGMGLQIADALRHGAAHIILAIGGSATNDAGMGMAAALGWRFYDAQGPIDVPTGKDLGRIERIEPPAISLPSCTVEVICDVTNPLYGPFGAAFVYARQKGADDDAIEQLDKGLEHFASFFPHISPHTAGAGAGGGMGFAALAFLAARLRRGIDLVLDLTRFEEALVNTDLVVTGEGKIDAQTAHGKLIHGICRRAALHTKPVVAFCGKLEATETEIRQIGLQQAWSINPPEMTDLQLMLQNTKNNLENTAKNMFADLPKIVFGTAFEQ
jgi:glycerate 2-kinase